MDREEIAQRSETIESASPPFPAIYRGALFPAGAGAQPAIVPVPLDYGLGTYMFPEDLRAYAWVGPAPGPGTVSRVRPAWRMDAGGGAVYLAYASAQKLSAAVGAVANSVLAGTSAPGGNKPRTVYGDVLFVKESLAQECIVDLGEADFKHVREKFLRWWAIHGSDPDQVLS
ncbi:hypothetical protein B0H11DRAFT_1958658 [Mycena galericulata]|nr:hypothetical protein B0H11DRAFT_1958658 [Mycena galericulata]